MGHPLKTSYYRYEFMAGPVRMALRIISPVSIRLIGLVTPMIAAPALADVGLIRASGLGTVVNGGAPGGCKAGLCSITGGTPGGQNLFHRFSDFDTRGRITGVDVNTGGLPNVIFGVTHPLGSYITKSISFSSPANFFFLSPGGIHMGGAAAFTNIQHLTLSSATGLKFDSGALFDVFSSTADDLRAISGIPLKGRDSLATDLASLKNELDLDINGDVVIDGGLLTVDQDLLQSLLVDSQSGSVVLRGENRIGFKNASDGHGVIAGASVNNDGTLIVEAGRLTVDGPGVDIGVYGVGADAELIFTAPVGEGRTLDQDSDILGDGDLHVEGGFLNVNGDFQIAKTGRISVTGGEGLRLSRPVEFKKLFTLSGGDNVH